MKNCARSILFIIVFVIGSHTVSGQTMLRASGKAIVNESGEPVILKGMGLGGWMLQEGYMLQTAEFANPQFQIRSRIEELIGAEDTEAFYDAWLANHVQKVDIDSLASWGFNSVRLPMHYNLYTLPIEDEPVAGEHTWLETGFALTDSLVKWCRSNEMYIILDLHAAPGGQGKDAGISDYDPEKPSLWESEANRAKTVALWRKIAERYADEPIIAGYDLINETNWELNGNALLAELYQNITEAIREVDQNHILFIEGNWFANDFTGLTPPWEDNIVYSPHKYWSVNDQASIQWALDIREAHNVPIYFGETGENSNTWFRNAILLFDEHDLGWAWWPMKKVESIAGPLSVIKTEGYQTLLDYWKDGGTQPTAEFAKETLMQLTEGLKMENCIYQKDVIDAMFRQVNEGGTIPFNTQTIPGKINVTDFDLGPNGEAYFDGDIANYLVTTGSFTAWNQGWSYRNDGVDIEKSTDPESNGYSIGWIGKGEWMQYDVAVQSSARYNVTVRVASTSDQGRFHLRANDAVVTETIQVPNTDGWQNWQSITIENVVMDVSDEKLIFYTDASGFNLSSISFTEVGPSTEIGTNFLAGKTVSNNRIQVDFNKPLSDSAIDADEFSLKVNGNAASGTFTSSGRSIIIDLSSGIEASDALELSYSGTSIAAQDGTILGNFSDQPIANTLTPVHGIPGQIEAEDFFVQSGIALENTSDTDGGENIGFLDRGDFLDYDVNITEAGPYTVTYRTAALSESGAISLSLIDEQGSSQLVHHVTFPPTGDWQTWASTSEIATLPAGKFTMRIEITEPLFNMNWISFNIGTILTVGENETTRVYPNPTTESLRILGDFHAPVAYKIFDMSGKILQSGTVSNQDSNLRKIDVSHLNKGAYLIALSSNGKVLFVNRFIRSE